MQPVPVALTTLATLALFAGALLPHATLPRAPRLRDALRRCGAIVSDLNRIVPVTRRRLRPRAAEPSWTALLAHDVDAASAPDRETALRALARGDGASDAGAILAAAASQEEGELRMIALHALIARAYPEGRAVFAATLLDGSDAERSLAVDGLAKLGAYDDLCAAFADRLEPLAAKAVLLYGGARGRRESIEELSARVDPARRDAIVALLSGILE